MAGAWEPAVLAALSSLLVLTAIVRRDGAYVLHLERICGSDRAEVRPGPVGARLARAARAPFVSRAARGRRAAIDRQSLDFVEVLLAAVEAGLPPAVAVERAAAMTSGALGEELEAVARQIALGMGWRAALEQLVARTGSTALRRLTVSLGRAHRLGTSPRQSLRSIADELRLERRTRAEELARRAPIKMLFPLVFLILPAFLLLTVGPVLLATVRSLR